MTIFHILPSVISFSFKIADILFSARSTYCFSTSTPTKRRFNFKAATPVVPLPIKGSKIKSFSLVEASITLLNALAQNNKDEAKIQVNRAYNVQQKAVETFSKEIQKQNEENTKDVAQMQKEVQEANQKNISDIMENYKEFKRFNGYANFVNPYVTYMSGLYLMTNGHSNSDYETASNYLKRVSGISRY